MRVDIWWWVISPADDCIEIDRKSRNRECLRVGLISELTHLYELVRFSP